MQVIINGKLEEIKEKESLTTLIGDRIGIAIAVNESVVPKEKWGNYILQEKDRIDVVAPFQGG